MSTIVVGRASAQSGFHPRWEIPGLDFRPNGAWRVRARQVSALRQQLLSRGNIPALNLMRVGPQATTAVSGTVVVPAVLFAYNNTDSVQFMRDTAQYNTTLFSNTPPGGNPYTLRTFYEQMSNNALSMTGKILGWVRLDSAETTYTGIPGSCSGNPFGTTNCNGIFSSNAISRMQAGFRQALARVDNQVDFGQFDNDGPDGIPNSGDDDGYVDMIMFAHPTKDGACGGFPTSSDASANNHIWSHRYVLLNDYVTNDHSNKPGFGNIRIADYFVTSALGGASACDTTQIMPIGTASHEFGHALGLPDLYDTGQSTEGSGEWGIMGSGNFSSPASPSRMEAWSLNEMGWVNIQPLTTSGTYSLDPAATSRTAAYVRPTGPNPRGEYFLIENRQGGPAGLADSAVIRRHCQRSGQPATCPGGLLIWHVDSSKIATSGFHNGNTVNAGSIHGLILEEADGLRQLWCPTANLCNRGDAGDPYPGTSGNTGFVYRTNPAATMTDGSFAGFGIDQIAQVVPDGPMSFRLRFGSLTVVRASDSSAVIQFAGGTYNVYRDLLDDGGSYAVNFQDGQISANGRTRFHFQSWSDGGPISHNYIGIQAGDTLRATVTRDFKLIATASPGGSIQADTAIDLSGTFIKEGRQVTLTATANPGITFGGWSGDTVSTNAVLALPMGRPYTVTATFGALLISSATARPGGIMGAAYVDTLRTSGGTGVNSWSITAGALPQGLTLDGASGIVSGYSHQTGNFTFTATVTSGAQTQSKVFTLTITAPTLATADVIQQLLGPGTPLTADQVRYLDFLGNNNATFDIGDFLAWVKATGAPLSAAVMQALQKKGGPR
ncbi:MAG TPA: M6 family metalloprotease domain-containing protein [Gemmatimonadales bacterium]|nr:M6 family metalloprotease domain-containing protein [Gemmatimonadales bacterium]